MWRTGGRDGRPGTGRGKENRAEREMGLNYSEMSQCQSESANNATQIAISSADNNHWVNTWARVQRSRPRRPEAGAGFSKLWLAEALASANSIRTLANRRGNTNEDLWLLQCFHFGFLRSSDVSMLKESPLTPTWLQRNDIWTGKSLVSVRHRATRGRSPCQWQHLQSCTLWV